MVSRVEDLKRDAQRATGTFGPACQTCAFGGRGDQCGYFGTYRWIARTAYGACGHEGRAWEPRPAPPPRLGLIPWLRRLLWGDAKP